MEREPEKPLQLRAGTRPNVLFILSDQHRWDCLGCYGNNEIRTPHLDALAAEGVRYLESHCPYPVCTPSRYSILSSRYVHEHRGWSNHCTLPPGTPTFASVLREAGYATAAVGKMHFTPTYLDVGFDRMYLAEQDGPGRWDDDYHRDLRDAGLVDLNDLEDQRAEYRKNARPEYFESLGALPSNLPARYHSTEWIATKALDVLDGWDSGGHLLMVGFIKPHHPFDPPVEWANAYEPDALTLLPGWTPACLQEDLEIHRGYFPHEKLTERSVRKAMAYYYATIEHMDAQIGRLVDKLKSKGLYENTLILYTSDHGEYMGYHHLMLKGGPAYEPLLRVPLMMRFPGGKRPAATFSGLVSNLDLAPTILGSVGCAIPDVMRGRDLGGAAEGHDMVFAECQRGDQVAVRTSRFKLLEVRELGKTYFFDLEHDPYELNNLDGHPDFIEEQRRLAAVLRDWRPGPLSEPYLDEDAPIVKGDHVRHPRDGHRATIEAYFAEKMKE